MLLHIRRPSDGSWYTLKLLRGPKGDKGEQGDPGTGLELLDAYDTLDELRAAHPTGNVGDCYAVGSEVYLWSPTELDWKHLGSIVGPAGKDGQDGAPGKDGVGIQAIEQTTTSTADGGENVITVTLTNGQTATFRFLNGSKGNAGPAGATPTSFPASGITGVLSPEHGGTGVASLAALAEALGVGANAGFVTGTYLGEQSSSTETWKEVTLGFSPSFVIVWSYKDLIPWSYDRVSNVDKYRQYAGFALNGYPALVVNGSTMSFLETTQNGFKVRNARYDTEDDNDSQAVLNQNNRIYCYIAGK